VYVIGNPLGFADPSGRDRPGDDPALKGSTYCDGTFELLDEITFFIPACHFSLDKA
jgi:hypothetical protein